MPIAKQMATSFQPRGAVGINGGNPLANGLVFAAYPIGNTFFDAYSGTRSAGGVTLANRKTIDGNASDGIEGRTIACAFPTFIGMDALTGPFSLFAEGSVLTNAGSNFAARSFSPTTGNGCGLRFDDSNLVTNGFFVFVDNSNQSSSNSDALGLNSENFRHRIMMTGDGVNQRAYAKGAADKVTVNATTPTAGSNRKTTMLVTGDGACSLFLAWSRVLSLIEYKALYANPWQVFSQPVKQFWLNQVSVASSFPPVPGFLSSVPTLLTM